MSLKQKFVTPFGWFYLSKISKSLIFFWTGNVLFQRHNEYHWNLHNIVLVWAWSVSCERHFVINLLEKQTQIWLHIVKHLSHQCWTIYQGTIPLTATHPKHKTNKNKSTICTTSGSGKEVHYHETSKTISNDCFDLMLHWSKLFHWLYFRK